MATGIRIRVDFVEGILTDPLANEAGPSTMNSAGLADLPAIDHATTGDYAAIVVDNEVLHVTSHTASATTATVQRGQEGTTIAAHDAGAAWHHGPTEDDFGDEWRSYDVTWTATTTNPTIGDGTLSGRYTQRGKTVHFLINLIIGSTTDPGSGVWSFGLPVTPSGAVQMCAARILDQGTDNMLAAAQLGATNITAVIYEGGNVVGDVNPIVWAANDRIDISGTYEAA